MALPKLALVEEQIFLDGNGNCDPAPYLLRCPVPVEGHPGAVVLAAPPGKVLARLKKPSPGRILQEVKACLRRWAFHVHPEELGIALQFHPPRRGEPSPSPAPPRILATARPVPIKRRLSVATSGLGVQGEVEVVPSEPINLHLLAAEPSPRSQMEAEVLASRKLEGFSTLRAVEGEMARMLEAEAAKVHGLLEGGRPVLFVLEQEPHAVLQGYVLAFLRYGTAHNTLPVRRRKKLGKERRPGKS